MGVRTVSQTIDLKNQLGAAATSKYITDISSTGITVHPSTVGQNIYYTQISDGFYIKQMAGSNIDTTNDTALTSIKATEIILGADTQTHTTINANSMTIYDGIKKLVDIKGTNENTGMIIYDGQGNNNTNIVASFTNNGVIVGKPQESHIQVSNVGINGTNAENKSTFDIQNTGKIRSTSITLALYEVAGPGETITYIPPDILDNGATIQVQIDYNFTNMVTFDFIGGTPASHTMENYNVTLNYDGDQTFELINNETTGSAYIHRLYYYDEIDAPAITFGTRTGEAGAFSNTLGQSLKVSYDNCTAVGKFNEDLNYLFMVGNGSYSNHRNIFEISNTGNVRATGDFLKVDKSGLGNPPQRAILDNGNGDVELTGSIYGPLTTYTDVITGISTHATNASSAPSDVSATIALSSAASFGRIAHAVFELTIKGNWAAGKDVYGTVTYADDFAPQTQADGIGFFGSQLVTCRMYGDGSNYIRFRNTGAIDGSSTNRTIYCSVTWIR